MLGLPGGFSLALLDEMLAVPGIRWVGATNELNAAYAEDVPVVQVTGTPATGARSHAQLLHHTLVDGDLDHFVRACSEVVGASASLRAPLAPSASDPAALATFTVALAEALAGAEAVLPEAHPASVGTSMGAMTVDPAVRDGVDGVDGVDGARLLVLVGTVFSDLLTGLFSHRFDVGSAVELSISRARVGRAFFDGVHLEDGLAALDEVLATTELATIWQRGLTPVVVLIDNAGYTIERVP